MLHIVNIPFSEILTAVGLYILKVKFQKYCILYAANHIIFYSQLSNTKCYKSETFATKFLKDIDFSFW